MHRHVCASYRAHLGCWKPEAFSVGVLPVLPVALDAGVHGVGQLMLQRTPAGPKQGHNHMLHTQQHPDQDSAGYGWLQRVWDNSLAEAM